MVFFFCYLRHRRLAGSNKFMAACFLLTGGAGFIGRQLCAELLTAGYHVRVLDSLIPQVHGDSEPLLPPDVELLKGDIRNVNLLDRAFRRHSTKRQSGVPFRGAGRGDL